MRSRGGQKAIQSVRAPVAMEQEIGRLSTMVFRAIAQPGAQLVQFHIAGSFLALFRVALPACMRDPVCETRPE